MQRFDLSTTPQTPWKNGGGATRELACWPPGADMDHFGWRVSVATVVQAGPFSAFPGVDRHIMLLEGGGLHLAARDGTLQHALDVPWQPFSFAGELALDCTVVGGTSQDFNLMLRRGAWQGGIDIVRGSVQPGVSPAGLCMVLEGTWASEGTQGDEVFKPGQGLWWSESAPHASLAPRGTGTLAWLALSPVPA